MGEIPASEVSPLCYVLMPFGLKQDPRGGPDIDFRRVYERAIQPGIADADMFPVRSDEEKLGGIIHKALFERLLICEFAVADLTTSNPNVLYQLGIRHAARPRSTLIIYAASTPLPLDVSLLRTQPYRLEADNELSEWGAAELREAVTGHLRELRALAAREAFTDSPLFQLITHWKPQPLSVEAAEFTYQRVKQNERVKGQLRLIRQGSADVEQRPSLLEGLASIRAEVSAAGDTVDAGVLTELMLSYRAFEAWSEMIAVYEAMPGSLQQQVPIRQQLAFAYNRRAEATGRADDRDEALDILENVEQQQGPSPETSGMIGRIYKSRWQEASEAQEVGKAKQFLVKAIDAYIRGFEANMRDVYPGINALTLLEERGGKDALAREEKLLPVVRFTAEQRAQDASASYWDHATMLELAVLASDVDGASEALDRALWAYTEPWQPYSTAGNLRIIAARRRKRGYDVAWITGLIAQLDAEAGASAISVATQGGGDKRQVFVSYARQNRPDVDTLVTTLTNLGCETWLDTRLRGGQNWWQEIVEWIDKCDVFVAIVSPATLKSVACKRELQRAQQLKKPVLPVSVEDVSGALPKDLAELQIVDYSRHDEEAASALDSALNTLPAAPPPPKRLPKPPDAPLSYLTHLVDHVSQSDTLTYEQQHQIAVELYPALRSADPEERQMALEILEMFRRRRELLADVAQMLDEFEHQGSSRLRTS